MKKCEFVFFAPAHKSLIEKVPVHLFIAHNGVRFDNVILRRTMSDNNFPLPDTWLFSDSLYCKISLFLLFFFPLV